MDTTPSRPSLSDPVSPSAGPIPLFDIHLRILGDSYLNFFQERRKLEETYAESLLKLHRKAKSIDSFLDDRSDLSTTRTAWNEVRDNVEREAQARLAFLNTLNEDVIRPLTSIKEVQERTRKRVKEDLKESGTAYQEFAQVTLPKLKSRYARKFAEVEDSKKAELNVLPSMPVHAPNPDQHPISPSKSHPQMGSRPMVTAPQPLRALERRPSASGAARSRSPSSNTAFSDLAHQGKRQLNSLMTFLDKSGTVKDSLGGGRESNALRTVRMKRELDEADKEYRNGVYRLETLRLRRTKILESGFTSLSMFVEECSSVVKQALVKYTDNLTATTTTETQLSAHARAVVDRINPERDITRITSQIPRYLASAIPDPILYQHGLFGESNDLMFGFSLVDYATSKNLQDGEIPRIVRACIDEIDSRGLDCEGIYRVSGRHAVVNSLQHEIEKDESKLTQVTNKADIYAVGSLLKLYLRELPDPVFRFPLQDRVQHSKDFGDHLSKNFLTLRGKIRRLAPVHQATLRAIVEHLARVAAHSEKNKMDPKNLAIVFGGVIFGEDEIPKDGDLLNLASAKDTLMEDLIVYSRALFDDRPAAEVQPTSHQTPAPALTPPPTLASDEASAVTAEPPLPPTPSEPAPHYPFGSRNTKVVNVPSNVDSLSALPSDFTPALPPRPANSIHPSSRAQPSPTKEQFVPPLPKKPDALPPSPTVTSSSFTSDLSDVTDDPISNIGTVEPDSPKQMPPS